jgi:hypothetical protein
MECAGGFGSRANTFLGLDEVERQDKPPSKTIGWAATGSSFSMPGKCLGLGSADPPISAQSLVQMWQQEGKGLKYIPTLLLDLPLGEENAPSHLPL